jgi:hypothetical protein
MGGVDGKLSGFGMLIPLRLRFHRLIFLAQLHPPVSLRASVTTVLDHSVIARATEAECLGG